MRSPQQNSLGKHIGFQWVLPHSESSFNLIWNDRNPEKCPKLIRFQMNKTACFFELGKQNIFVYFLDDHTLEMPASPHSTFTDISQPPPSCICRGEWIWWSNGRFPQKWSCRGFVRAIKRHTFVCRPSCMSMYDREEHHVVSFTGIYIEC